MQGSWRYLVLLPLSRSSTRNPLGRAYCSDLLGMPTTTFAASPTSTPTPLVDDDDDDDLDDLARPLCTPPTWDDARNSGACACIAVPMPSCTRTMTHTALPSPTIPVGGGQDDYPGKNERRQAPDEPCTTAKFVTVTIANRVATTMTTTPSTVTSV
ncbi:hypothetical protein DL770_004058 [Monosporascus sp. CRB-9-2]|nr:hypothetical protein DL770_004058 [Monosporascus sp. CRB-9-2]